MTVLEESEEYNAQAQDARAVGSKWFPSLSEWRDLRKNSASNGALLKAQGEAADAARMAEAPTARKAAGGARITTYHRSAESIAVAASSAPAVRTAAGGATVKTYHHAAPKVSKAAPATSTRVSSGGAKITRIK